MKLLFPFTGSKRFYFGIGAKYDNVSYTAPSNIQVSFTHAYDSLQAGPDLAYKLSFEYIDFLFNPYLYYSFYDTWLQTTTTPAYQQTYSPYLIHNLNYGIGLSALFKYIMSSSSLVSGFYFGPNAYYSQGYIIYRSTTDSKGNRFYGGEGSYYFYSINFTIGMFF